MRKISPKSKRGYFFSLDALIALLIILGVVLFIKPSAPKVSYETSVHNDLLEVLSSLKIGEINNTYVKQLIADGNITNLNNSVLEQIGEFYSDADTVLSAFDLAQNILNTLALGKNIAIFYDVDGLAYYGSGYIDAREILTARQILSGITGAGESTTGYASIAYLFSENKVDYFYFGGYVGDGNNITVRADGEVIGGKVEGVFSRTFDLYVNNNFISSHNPPLNVPYNISLNSTMGFIDGPNNITFRSTGLLYIAGGYIKIIYDETSVPISQNKKYFPGIDGLINIYDSFYVPGQLNSLEAYIHYNSSYPIFFTIGNTSIYRGNSSGNPIGITLNNPYLDSLLDYDSLTNKTIPFRLALDNISYFSNFTGGIDIFSVTDLSGSMDDNCNPASCEYSCGSCIGNCKTCDSRAANYVLIEKILNISGNRIGLTGYESATRNSDSHALSINETSLQNLIGDEWDASGDTCICCGINRARDNFFHRLFAYYPLDGDTLDYGVQSNDAVIAGNPVYSSGVLGDAVTFDGVDDYLNAGLIEEMNYSGTIAFWFKLNKDFNSSTVNSMGLWSKYYNPSNNAFISLRGTDLDSSFSGLERYLGRGTIQAKIEGPNGGISYVRTTTNSWTKDVWYHITLTWDGGNAAIYLNGIRQNFVSAPRGMGYAGGNNNFGRSEFESVHLASPKYLNGSMDEIRVYKRPLSEIEILAIAGVSSSCGNNITEGGEVCDGELEPCDFGGLEGMRVCNDQCNGFDACQNDKRYRTEVVMSDGRATASCVQQGVTIDRNGDGTQDGFGDDAVQAACDAYNQEGITVYAIGFDINLETEEGQEAEATLRGIADCGHGNYYYANVNDLIDIYTNISEEVIKASYYEQTISLEEGDLFTKLYPDSYLLIDYTQPVPQGMIVTSETPTFGNTISEGNVTIPNGDIYDVRAISYSGANWTSKVEVFNFTSLQWEYIFNLSDYGSEYTDLGDPYVVHIPPEYLIKGNNTIKIRTGLNPSSIDGGSPYNKIIYSMVTNYSGYSPITSSAEGCTWHIEFEDGEVSALDIPSDYAGIDDCYYNSTIISGIRDHAIFHTSDSLEYAVYLLLSKLDLDDDGKVETKFSGDDLSVTFGQTTGIPFTWETEVQIRTWT